MHIEEVKIYDFDDLSADIKEKVSDKHRYWNVEHDWWENEGMLLEPSDDEKKEIGIKDGNLYVHSDKKFDVLFTYNISAFDFDRGQYIHLEKIDVNDEDLFRRLLGIPMILWEYTYWTTITDRDERNTQLSLELDISDDEPEDFLDYIESISEDYYDTAESIWADMMDNALKQLSKSYEWLTSDEQIVDSLKANECTFLKNGDRWN